MGDEEKNRTGFCDLNFFLLILSSHLVLTALIPLISVFFLFFLYITIRILERVWWIRAFRETAGEI